MDTEAQHAIDRAWNDPPRLVDPRLIFVNNANGLSGCIGRLGTLEQSNGGLAIKIAVIGHIRHAIAAPFMGGMELHCHALVAGLRARGHRVTPFAAKGSDLPDCVPICDAPYEQVLPWAQWRGTDALYTYQQRAFEAGWAAILKGDFDVVHNNSLFPDLMDWAARDGIAMVTSQHVPPYPLMRRAVEAVRDAPSQQITVTSADQLRLWTGGASSNVAVVHNGIDVACWPVREQPGEGLVWFGRITENKGAREAVAAAVMANTALDIIGHIEDADYFHQAIAPHLSASIRYCGHLSGDALRNRIAGAAAAIVTPMWDEPFGLVAIEAMASGVPVIGFDRGALREVVGPCGVLVPAGDIAALANAMGRWTDIPRSECRMRVQDHFSIAAMIAGYEDAYERAIAGAASASNMSRTAALLA